MAGVWIFAAVFVAFTVKDGVLSCSLPSHKSGTSPCSSSATDSTTDDSASLPYHHHPGTKLHKKPSPCHSSASSSSCSTSAITSLPTGLPSKPLISNSNLPSSASDLQIKPFVTSTYNMALLDSLIKFLTPSVGVNTPVSHVPFNKRPIVPSSPFLNYAPFLAPFSKTPNILSKPIGATLPGSVSSSVPCGVSPSSTIPQVPVQHLPVLSQPSTFFQTDSFKPDLTNTMQKFPSIFPEPTGLFGSKPTHMQPCSTFTPTPDKNTATTGLIGSKLTPMPPFTLFTPLLDKNSVPLVSKPQTLAYHSNPCASSLSSSFDLPNVTPGFPCASSSSGNTALGQVSLLTPKTDLNIALTSTTSTPVPEKASEQTSAHIPEEFPASVSTPASTSIPSTLSDHKQDILKHILKMLQSPKPIITPKPTSLPPYLPVSNAPFTLKTNTSSISSQVQKPVSASPVCLTLNLSSCPPSDSVLPLKSTVVPVTPPSIPLQFPTFTSSVPYGYNPAFIKLLVNQLFSSLASSPHSLPSSFPVPKSILKATPVFSPVSNPLPKPTDNGQLSGSDSIVQSNKFLDITPTPLQVPVTSPNISSFNINVNFTTNFNNTLVTSTTPSKTSSIPYSSTSSPQLSTTLNATPESTTVSSTSNPCDSSRGPIPGPPQTFSNLFPVSTPLPFSKPFLEPVKNIIPETVPQPTITPLPYLPQLPGPILCRLKHLRLHQPHGSHLPHSTHVSHSPHSPHLSYHLRVYPSHSSRFSHSSHSTHLPHSLHSPHLPLRCPQFSLC